MAVTSDGAGHQSVVTQFAGAQGHGLQARLKILFLLPFPPDFEGSHGGSRAVAAMVEMLGQHHRLWVIYLTANGDPPPRRLPSNCERLLPLPKNAPRMVTGSRAKRRLRLIAEAIWREPLWVKECWSPVVASEIVAAVSEFEPDIVHHEMRVMAQYIPAVRSASPSAACIVTEHDAAVTDYRELRSLRGLAQWLRALAELRAWRRYVRRTERRADSIITFTESDAAALRRLLGPSSPPISVIPLRLPESGPSAAASAEPVQSDFLFVGNFLHPPNVDSARRLVTSIFPMIRRDLPEARLTMVGPNLPKDVADAASDRVTLTGWVEDPSLYLAGAAVVLVPLRQGGGLRVKIVEACAAGKAIIASPTAVEGLTLQDGEEVMLAESDGEFAKAAVQLIKDAEARARLEAASRRWWEEEQDSGRWAEEYAALYASLPIRCEGEAR